MNFTDIGRQLEARNYSVTKIEIGGDKMRICIDEYFDIKVKIFSEGKLCVSPGILIKRNKSWEEIFADYIFSIPDFVLMDNWGGAYQFNEVATEEQKEKVKEVLVDLEEIIRPNTLRFFEEMSS